MKKQDLEYKRGDEQTFSVTVTGNYSDSDLLFGVKESYEPTAYRYAEVETFTKTYDAETGLTTIGWTLTPLSLADKQAKVYYYEIVADEETTLIGGNFILKADVITPYDNLGELPDNLPRVMLANPNDFDVNDLVIVTETDGLKNFTPIDIEAFNILTKGYHKEYIALLTQSGTDAPVATVFRNTIGTVNFSRIQEGRYAIEFSGVSPTANFYSPQVIANGDDNIKYANSYPIYDLDGGQNLVGTVYLHKSDNPSLLNIVTTDGTGNEFDGILQKGIFLHFIVYE